MRGACLLLLALVCASGTTAQTADGRFLPQSYQTGDGALLVTTADDFVEPYFSTKALLVAGDSGLDIRGPALAWIKWALARQRTDGRFERYCRKSGQDWHACGTADADDSILALWLQLLYRLSPDGGLPAEWQESAQKARKQLAKLRNSHLGLYYVSGQNHVALFMDNVEVYSALKEIARTQSRFGDNDGAKKTEQEAEKLATAIQHVFWDERRQWYRPSMQKNQPQFYPDVVAQVYPWLSDFPAPGLDRHAAWADWKSKYASAWLEGKYDPHPWGLVAMAAKKLGDPSTAVCWLGRAQSLRYSQRWNILEEAVYQGLEHQLNNQLLADAAACSRVTP